MATKAAEIEELRRDLRAFAQARDRTREAASAAGYRGDFQKQARMNAAAADLDARAKAVEALITESQEEA